MSSYIATGPDADGMPPLPPAGEATEAAEEPNRPRRPAAEDLTADDDRNAHRGERDRDGARSRKHGAERHGERDRKREREPDSHSYRHPTSFTCSCAGSKL